MNKIGLTNVICIIGLVGYYGWARYYQPSWLSYRDMPAVLDKLPGQKVAVLHPGDQISFHVTKCSTLAEESSYVSTLRLEPVTEGLEPINMQGGARVSAKPGCHLQHSSLIVVPVKTPSGEYYAAGISATDADVGPDKQVPWQTEIFIVKQEGEL